MNASAHGILGGLCHELGRAIIDEPGRQSGSPLERGSRIRGSVDDEWGRSESFDPG